MTRKDRFVTTPNRDLPEFSPADLNRLAQVDQLLVAMDFDGTLAEFSDSPTDVRAVPGAVEALQDLAACPGVLVVLISGRHLTQLSDVSGLPILANPGDGDVRLVGSHGAQPADQPADGAGRAQLDALKALGEKAEELAATDPGLWVEYKPLSVGLHSRQAEDIEVARKADEALAEFAETLPTDIQVTWGRDILELSVAISTKGSYIAGLLARLADQGTDIDSVFFGGDDVTDETVMAVLREQDLGVHVGGRLTDRTRATRALESPFAMRDALVALATARR